MVAEPSRSRSIWRRADHGSRSAADISKPTAWNTDDQSVRGAGLRHPAGVLAVAGRRAAVPPGRVSSGVVWHSHEALAESPAVGPRHGLRACKTGPRSH